MPYTRGREADTTPSTISRKQTSRGLYPLLYQRLFQAVSAVSDGPKCQKQHLDQAEPPGKLVSHPRYQVTKQTIKDTQYGSLCAMVLPVSGLKDFKKIIARQMFFQLNQDNFLKNL